MLSSPQVPLACLVPDTHLPVPRVLCWTFYRPGTWMGASPWLYLSLGVPAMQRVLSSRVGGKGHRLPGCHCLLCLRPEAQPGTA